MNILTKECNSDIANLYYKKIHDTFVNKHCIFKDQTQLNLFFWLPTAILYLLPGN